MKRLIGSLSLVVFFLVAAPVQAQGATSPAKSEAKQKTSKSRKAGHKSPKASKSVERVKAVPQIPSEGQKSGLHLTRDELDLRSSVAYVVDQDTHEVLFSKNNDAVLPIASITKLMTGVIIQEANLDLSEPVTITADDVDTIKGSRSRLAVGVTLSRGELLHLALMASENRAAHALARSFPQGYDDFIQRMNEKARQLGMSDTRYVEPTGLSSANQSSAKDLALLVDYASNAPLLRELSTSPNYSVQVGKRLMTFNTTNRLIKNPHWEIGLQKTGYISEAGQCLVMQAKVAGRKLIMVFLDSAGRLSRVADAERVKRWLEQRHQDSVVQVDDSLFFGSVSQR